MIVQAGGSHWSGWRIARWGTAAVLLSIPALMMQVSDEWDWSGSDFVIIGLFMAGALLAYELAVRTSVATAYRAGAAIACVASFVLLWVNGAVGIIGSENNDANLMYFGVIFIGLIGAMLARLQPFGMARTLFGMAIAQAAVPIIAFIAGAVPPGDWLRLVVLNGFFVTLFIASALLFRKAAQDRAAGGVAG